MLGDKNMYGEKKEGKNDWRFGWCLGEVLRCAWCPELCLPVDGSGQRGLFYPKLGGSQSPWPRETWSLALAGIKRETA